MTAAEATPELDIADQGDRAFLGHPKGLGYLAFTEAWERFSYYAMQTLLVLYMAKELLLPGHIENVVGIETVRDLFGGIDGQPLASAIFGTYAALVYLTPIFGGLIADRWLGRTAAVTIGALLMSIGHFMMAFEQSFLFALLFLVAGVGLFKGNIASQVGGLYKPADLRRADAFQIFYIAINAGVIAAPLVAGTLGEVYGWHWGFGTAGVGMVIGLLIYLAGRKYLPARSRSARPALPRARASPRPTLPPSSRSSC
jgi:POT family proton-dependent oligopeptide transporter